MPTRRRHHRHREDQEGAVMKTKRKKPKIYWAGFTNGKLYAPLGLSPFLYVNKYEGLRYFQEVRKVCIVEVKP